MQLSHMGSEMLGAAYFDTWQWFNLSNTFYVVYSFSYVLLRLSSSCSVKRSAPPCVRPGEQEVSREFFTNDVNELLDYLIKEGTEQIGKAPEEMTEEEKKQVISYLDQKGAMLITKSGPKICRYLGISKFTLYNYLDEIHSEQEREKPNRKKQTQTAAPAEAGTAVSSQRV